MTHLTCPPTACTVLDEFFPYLAQMIINMRGCMAHNDLWPWPISSRCFSCDIAYFIDHIHMWYKYNACWDSVSCAISISRSQNARSHRSFEFLHIPYSRMHTYVPQISDIVLLSTSSHFRCRTYSLQLRFACLLSHSYFTVSSYHYIWHGFHHSHDRHAQHVLRR